jgi:ATP-dependent DNA helicase RecG
MTQDELNLILQEGEGYTIEFKENINSDLSKELVAFANASGGRVLIGIRDDKTISGLNIDNNLKSRVQDTARNCDPSVQITLESFQNILIVNVAEGNGKPYRATDGFYLRVGPNSQKLETREIIDFIQSEGRIKFDELLNKDCDFNTQFVKTLLANFLKLADITKTTDDISTLQNLSVIEKVNDTVSFRNAGVLFFSDNPSQFIPQYVIVCARYEGNEKVNILDRKEFGSDIISNIENAINFVRQHLKVKIIIENNRREEVPEIPVVALREAIVNAVTHRDYFERGANIMIEVFNDRIVITNPGGLPKGFPEESFGKISLSRNPTIASLLLRAKYIEKMGTGINRIKKLFEENSLPDPVFKYDTFFTVILKRKDMIFAFRNKFKTDETQSKRMVALLSNLYLRQIINVTGLAKKHSVSDRTIRTDLEKLSELGLIKLKGTSKDRTYEITARGDEFVADNM